MFGFTTLYTVAATTIKFTSKWGTHFFWYFIFEHKFGTQSIFNS